MHNRGPSNINIGTLFAPLKIVRLHNHSPLLPMVKSYDIRAENVPPHLFFYFYLLM